MNTVEARSEKILREKMEAATLDELGVTYSAQNEPLSSSRTSQDRERQRKKVQEEGAYLKQELSASRRARRTHQHHSFKIKKKKVPPSSRKHGDTSKEQSTLVSAEEMVRQKWTKARREQYYQSLAAAPAQPEDSVPSEDDEAYDTDATPRRKATRESSSESERGHYDSDSSLNSFDDHVQDLTGVKKPSEENHPPTDLDFAKGMDKGARKLKLIAKDQEEAVERKKVDYDHLRDLLEGYAKDPKTADHDRLNELLAAMGNDESEEYISDSVGDPSSSLALWNASIKGLVGYNCTVEPTESVSPGQGVTSAIELKRDILETCGVEDVEFVSVPRTTAMPRRRSVPREDNKRSMVSPGNSGRSNSSQDTLPTDKTDGSERHSSSDKGGGSIGNQPVDKLKRDILEACGVEDVEFVSVPRTSAMPRTRNTGSSRKDSDSGDLSGSDQHAHRTEEEENKGRGSSSESKVPMDNQGLNEIKRDVLEACGVEECAEFVSVPRKSAMPRKEALSESNQRPVETEMTPSLNYREGGENSQDIPLSTSEIEDIRQSRSKETVADGRQATLDKRNVFKARGVEDNVDFVLVPRKSTMPRKEALAESKPRAVQSNAIPSSNLRDIKGISPEELPVSTTIESEHVRHRPSSEQAIVTVNQATLELKRDVLQACGVEENVEFVSVPRKSAMPRKGTRGESNARPVHNEMSSSATSIFQETSSTTSKGGSIRRPSSERETLSDPQPTNELKRDILEACGVEQYVDFVSVPRKSAMPRKGALVDSKPTDSSTEFVSSGLQISSSVDEDDKDTRRMEELGDSVLARLLHQKEEENQQASSFGDADRDGRRSEELGDSLLAFLLHQEEEENLAAANRRHDRSTPQESTNLSAHRSQDNKLETIELLMADGDGVKVEEFVVVPLRPPSLSMRTGAKAKLGKPRSKGVHRESKAVSDPKPRHDVTVQAADTPNAESDPPKTDSPLTVKESEVVETPPRSTKRGRKLVIPRHKKELNDALCPEEFLEVTRKPSVAAVPKRIMRGLKEEKVQEPKELPKPKQAESESPPTVDDHKKDLLESFCPDQFMAVSLKPPATLMDESRAGAVKVAGSHSSENRVDANTDAVAPSEVSRSSDVRNKSPTRPFKLGRLMKGRKGRKKANK